MPDNPNAVPGGAPENAPAQPAQPASSGQPGDDLTIVDALLTRGGGQPAPASGGQPPEEPSVTVTYPTGPKKYSPQELAEKHLRQDEKMRQKDEEIENLRAKTQAMTTQMEQVEKALQTYFGKESLGVEPGVGLDRPLFNVPTEDRQVEDWQGAGLDEPNARRLARQNASVTTEANAAFTATQKRMAMLEQVVSQLLMQNRLQSVAQQVPGFSLQNPEVIETIELCRQDPIAAAAELFRMKRGTSDTAAARAAGMVAPTAQGRTPVRPATNVTPEMEETWRGEFGLTDAQMQVARQFVPNQGGAR